MQSQSTRREFLLRTGITSAGKTVSSEQVLHAMEETDAGFVLPAWAESWVEADAQRPWPP